MRSFDGLERKGASSQLKKALTWLNRNEFVPTGADYIAVGLYRARARMLGFVLELPDCLVAAAAIRLGMPVVTGNPDDFRVIQRTKVGLVLH